jgi:hypothetical protein
MYFSFGRQLCFPDLRGGQSNRTTSYFFLKREAGTNLLSPRPVPHQFPSDNRPFHFPIFINQRNIGLFPNL